MKPQRRYRRSAAVLAATVLSSACVSACFSPAHSTAPTSAAWVVREVVGNASVVDENGQVWKRATGFSGGTVRGATKPVGGTNTPDLYSYSDDGVEKYRTTVPRPGTYAVALFFADTSCQSAACRVFRVTVQGQPLAQHLDIAGTVGSDRALTLVTEASVRGTSLAIRFAPILGDTTVSAVEVAAFPGKHGSLRWHDEFNQPANTGPDPHRWSYDTGGGGWGNQELETYTTSRTNARLDGAGHLLLAATRALEPDGSTSYYSARLTTAGHFAFKYGVLRARVAVPLGQGLWPAIWMLGDDVKAVGWPASGEIDVLEMNGAKPGYVWVHGLGPQDDGSHYAIGAVTSALGSPIGYHVVQLTWTPIGLGFSVDGESFFGLTPLSLEPDQEWQFNQPFRVLLNLAVGGTFVGDPSIATVFPAVMSVDYVRIYR